jgi:N-acetylglucosaminyl-diphospho-decaprenol L-rhamnosyltransferase
LTITVIVVNYRSALLVGDLLESIKRRGDGWVRRIIIVDNASGDGSVAALNATVARLGLGHAVEVVDAGRNAGFGAGNNAGANTAKGIEPTDLMWFLNPDTLVDDLDLGEAVGWFERDPHVGIVGTGLSDGHGHADLAGHRDPTPISEFVRNAGALYMLRRYLVSDPGLDRPGPVDWVSGASLLVRTSAFEQLGGFDEKFFLYFEEVDLCRRARSSGWKVLYEPRVRVVHLEGQTTGLSRTKARPRYWYESRRRYFVKHFGRFGLLCADAAWLLGRGVARLRRRSPDSCRWIDMWRCDARVIVGREQEAAQRES